MATCWRRCSHAFELSKAVGLWPLTVVARSISASHPANAGCFLPFVERDVVTSLGPLVKLLRARDLRVGVEQHLYPLRDPAHRAGDREQHREHLDREAHRLVDEVRVEVYVRIELAADEVL